MFIPKERYDSVDLAVGKVANWSATQIDVNHAIPKHDAMHVLERIHLPHPY
jgi:hypothetical protein